MKLRQNEGGGFLFFFHRMTIFQPQIQAVKGDSNIICISGPYFNIHFYMFSHIKTCRKKTVTINQQNEPLTFMAAAAAAAAPADVAAALLPGSWRHF